jgi:hypothetical protein
MKNLNQLSNCILFEKYSKEIAYFNDNYKKYDINKNMLFYRIKSIKNRSVVSFLIKNHFSINYATDNTYDYFKKYKCLIVGLYVDSIIDSNVYYILEITNTKNNEITNIHIPIEYVGKGNKINWKKEKENE